MITENGELYTWGCGLDGQLGHNSRSSRRQPTHVQGLKLQNIQCVGCGGGHTVVADDKGKLYAFGNNRNGQLHNEVVDFKSSFHLSGNYLAGFGPRARISVKAF